MEHYKYKGFVYFIAIIVAVIIYYWNKGTGSNGGATT
jgi:hypothetical protein